jgi:hypothetical protein
MELDINFIQLLVELIVKSQTPNTPSHQLSARCKRGEHPVSIELCASARIKTLARRVVRVGHRNTTQVHILTYP